MSFRTKALAGVAAAGVAWLLLAGWHKADSSPPPKPVANPPRTETDLFTGSKVQVLSLELSAAAVRGLRQEPREWVRGTLRTDSGVYGDVAVHIKGSQGSLQTIDQRPSLTVSFNRHSPGRRFHGLRKIHLNNCAEDPSAMTQILCGDLCRQAGLPAARSCHATLTLNGRELGLYVLTEGLTKDFLAQHFSRTDGNLYDGGFRRDIDQRLERIGGDGPDTQEDRQALLQAARESDPHQRWERLKKILDTERFATLLAITALTWNWDGYPMARNNYRIYHDPASDRMIFIPHGLDQMFWEPQGAIYPRMRGLVAAAVMATPEGRALYQARLAALHRGLFQPAVLNQKIEELTERIEAIHPGAHAQAARLKALIAARAKFVGRQLGPNGE